MKHTVRWLALLLALMLCLSLLPAAALAVEEAPEEPAEAAEEVVDELPEESAEELPAEDGLVYFETSADLEKTGETGPHTVVARSWAYAESQDVPFRDEKAELRVVVDANRENVTCAWYKVGFQLDFDTWQTVRTYTEIEGETGLTLTVHEMGSYACRVSSTAAEGSAENDPAVEDTLEILFNADAYPEYDNPGEPVSIYPTGEEPGVWRTNVVVPEEGPVTLSAEVQINSDKVDKDSLRYEWCVGDSPRLLSYMIEGATGASLTLQREDIGPKSYIFIAHYNYLYESWDGKVSEWAPRTAYLQFDLQSTGDFPLSLEHDAKVVNYEYVRGSTMYVGLSALLGEPVHLKAVVAENKVDAVTVQSWLLPYSKPSTEDIEPAFTIPRVEGYTEVLCLTEIGGNFLYKIAVQVTPLNLISARPEGAAEGETEVTIRAQRDGTYDLRALAEAVRPEEIGYFWGYQTPYEQRHMSYTGVDTITVAHLSESAVFFCDVYDGYRNVEHLTFRLELEGEPAPAPVTPAEAAAALAKGDAPAAADALRALVGLGTAEAGDKLATAKKLLNMPVEDLIAAIGEPISIVCYDDSCAAVGGQDRVLVYDGFEVETLVKPNGTEIVIGVF